MSGAETLSLTRRCFLAWAALTAAVPSVAMACLAAAPAINPASGSADSRDLPAATLLTGLPLLDP